MKRPGKEKAIERLQKAIDGIPELLNQHRDSPAFQKWHRDTEIVITHTFGEKSRHLDDFLNVHHALRIRRSTNIESAYQEAHINGLRSAQSVLESMIEEVQEYWPA
jgi:hypothetical protein